jgi:hypothetical protein
MRECASKNLGHSSYSLPFGDEMTQDKAGEWRNLRQCDNDEIVNLVRKYLPDCTVLYGTNPEYVAMSYYKRPFTFQGREIIGQFIVLSPKVITRDSWKATVLHEIAHALTGNCGHDPKWKNKFVDLALEHNLPYWSVELEATKAKDE